MLYHHDLKWKVHPISRVIRQYSASVNSIPLADDLTCSVITQLKLSSTDTHFFWVSRHAIDILKWFQFPQRVKSTCMLLLWKDWGRFLIFNTTTVFSLHSLCQLVQCIFLNYHITVEMYTLRIAILQFDTNMPFSKYCPPVGRKGETKCTENSKNLRHKVNMNLLGYSLATCQQCVQMNSSVGDKKEWWWRAFMTNQVMNIRLVVTVFEILISVLSDRYLNLWPSVNY